MNETSGDFDQIWKCSKDGKDIWIVVEAKGGSSDLGSRRVDGGTGPRAEQGSAVYFQDIIRNMQKSEGSLGKAAVALEDAQKAKHEIRYVHVSAPIESSSGAPGSALTSRLDEVSIREFDISTGTPTAPVTGKPVP